MTPKEMQQNSAKKVQQVLDLMRTLHLRIEAREKVDPAGFIKKTVFWIDDENYPTEEKQAALPLATGETGATGEVALTGEAEVKKEDEKPV